MILTRSPLPSSPKGRFSLDLHVLGAPPAFVLSQDQTLREDLSLSATWADCYQVKVSLELNECPPRLRVTGVFLAAPRLTHESGLQTNALLSFQRPNRLALPRKKPPVT